MSGALVGLTLGAAAGAWAEREGLVPKELPSMSDVPTDWSSGMSSLSKVRETLFGGASVEDVVEEKVISDAVSSVSKESGKIFNSVTTFGTSPSSSRKRLASGGVTLWRCYRGNHRVLRHGQILRESERVRDRV